MQSLILEPISEVGTLGQLSLKYQVPTIHLLEIGADLRSKHRKEKSAPAIQRLVDLGASIVGKTKLCAFAQWEEPTEAIEYTSPWSPRADGFQSSGGSSNGSGAAIAAYE